MFILGRQSDIAKAEIESLFTSTKIQKSNDKAMVVDIPPEEVDFNRIGGSTRLAKLLTYLPTTKWNEIESYITDTLPQHLDYVSDGKIRFGLSAYNLSVSPKQIHITNLKLKKFIKTFDKSVRVVPNVNSELNTAQVIHNQLTGPTGIELLIISNGDETILAQTVKVQDISAYAARDQKRPKRDARIGMLPPKLAQIIINLAVGELTHSSEVEAELLDPFCGTGVVLQEAMLMGYRVRGSDLDDRMVEYSKQNIQWLNDTIMDKNVLKNYPPIIEVADGTNYKWLPAPSLVACETYLGRPFSKLPDNNTLYQVIRDVNTIHEKFLKNARQFGKDMRICLAVPAWKTRKGFIHLPLLDSLEKLGYTRVSFVHADNNKLIYHREGQVVGRELVVLIRK